MVQPAIVVRYDKDQVTITHLPHDQAATLYKWIATEARLFSNGSVDYDGDTAAIACSVSPGDDPDRHRVWWLRVQRRLDHRIEELYPDHPLDSLHREGVERKKRWGM